MRVLLLHQCAIPGAAGLLAANKDLTGLSSEARKHSEPLVAQEPEPCRSRPARLSTFHSRSAFRLAELHLLSCILRPLRG